MIPKLTVQQILEETKARPLDVITRTGKRGQTQRGGWWISKPCIICGTMFDVRQKPWKPPNRRVCCGPVCTMQNKQNITDEWRRNNPEMIAAEDRRYRAKHGDRIRARDRARHAQPARNEYNKRKSSEWYYDHREYALAKAAERYQENREAILADRKARYAEAKNAAN